MNWLVWLVVAVLIAHSLSFLSTSHFERAPAADLTALEGSTDEADPAPCLLKITSARREAIGRLAHQAAQKLSPATVFVCDAACAMYGFIALGIVGATSLMAWAVVVMVRRHRSDDLGSVSAAWTTEHSAGYRGGDGSTS
jgi:hypothetical protein